MEQLPAKNILIFVAIILFFSSSLTLAIPSDIEGHRAEEKIVSLLKEGFLTTRSDGLFHPEEKLIRADLHALALIKELALVRNNEIPDLRGHLYEPFLSALCKEGLVTLFPDGSFRPLENVNRGEIASILVRILNLDNSERAINLEELSGPYDMSSEHWALEAVKLTNSLGLTSIYPDGSYRPNESLTRAEYAEILDALKNLKTMTSFLQEVYPTSGKLALKSLEDQQNILSINSKALLGRNNRLVDIDQLKRSDKVYLILNQKEEVVYLKAYGLMTKDDLTTEISHLTNGLLTTQDIDSLLEGDYKVLQPALSGELAEQMVNQGFSSQEIDSLLSQDWNQLEELGKERLSELISMETSLPLEMTRAIVRRDWDSLQELAKIEIMQQLLQQVMDSNILQS